MSDNIILIGFMGVGKGRTARALAAATGRFAIDTDDLIESLANTKIRALFASQGEPAFRRLEHQVADWLEHQVHDTIISTGGGFFMVPNLRQLGTVVYLHAGLHSILDRIHRHPQAKRKIKKRPLLVDPERAGALYQSRLPLYRRLADIEINVEGLKAVEIAAELQSRIHPIESPRKKGKAKELP